MSTLSTDNASKDICIHNASLACSPYLFEHFKSYKSKEMSKTGFVKHTFYPQLPLQKWQVQPFHYCLSGLCFDKRYRLLCLAVTSPITLVVHYNIKAFKSVMYSCSCSDDQ
jgi:hypothetical protein